MSNVMTVRELSEKLHIGRDNAYKLMRLKGFPSIMIGNKFIVLEDDVEDFLKEHRDLKIYLE